MNPLHIHLNECLWSSHAKVYNTQITGQNIVSPRKSIMIKSLDHV